MKTETSRGLLREAPAVKFSWIAAEKAAFRVSQLCPALGVWPSGSHAWQRRPESAHRQRALAAAIGTPLDNPPFADRLGHEGRRVAVQEFSYERMVGDICAVYREIIGAIEKRPSWE